MKTSSCRILLLEFRVQLVGVIDAGIHVEERRHERQNDHRRVTHWKRWGIRVRSQALVAASAVGVVVGMALEAKQEVVLEGRRIVPGVERRDGIGRTARQAMIYELERITCRKNFPKDRDKDTGSFR